MEVASDQGMTTVTGKAKAKSPASIMDVGGLVTAVEAKMAELMAWHAQQVRQLETDKIVLETHIDQQREALSVRSEELDLERKQLADRVEQVNDQRRKLVELTSKLRAEESALSREWAEVHRDREQLARQIAEVAEQRARVAERAQSWLKTTADDLSTPLKLTESGADDGEASDADDRQAA